MSKRALNLTISEVGRDLLARLAECKGISQSAVVELAVRQMADNEGIETANGNGDGERAA